jgi:hypothetical protein
VVAVEEAGSGFTCDQGEESEDLPGREDKQRKAILEDEGLARFGERWKGWHALISGGRPQAGKPMRGGKKRWGRGLTACEKRPGMCGIHT